MNKYNDPEHQSDGDEWADLTEFLRQMRVNQPGHHNCKCACIPIDGQLSIWADYQGTIKPVYIAGTSFSMN